MGRSHWCARCWASGAPRSWQYCQERQLEPVHDPSNADLTFFRNRLRHELIPTLGQYNPRVKEALWRMAQVLAGDQAVLEEVTRQAWASCLCGQGAGYVMLSLGELRGLSLGLQRGVLRTAIDCLRPDLPRYRLRRRRAGVGWVNQPPHTGQADLVSGLSLYFENERLFIMESGADLAEGDWPLVAGGEERRPGCAGKPAPGKWLGDYLRSRQF